MRVKIVFLEIIEKKIKMSADNNLKKRKVADFVKDGMETEDIRKMVQEIMLYMTENKSKFASEEELENNMKKTINILKTNIINADNKLSTVSKIPINKKPDNKDNTILNLTENKKPETINLDYINRMLSEPNVKEVFQKKFSSGKVNELKRILNSLFIIFINISSDLAGLIDLRGSCC